MRFQAGIQVILLITAAVIVFTVIKPKFESIKATQAEVASYQNAVNNIGEYNSRLETLMNEADSISSENLEALYRYLPEEVDAVAVGRDIDNIADENNMLLVDVVAEEPKLVVTELPQADVAATELDPAFDTGMEGASAPARVLVAHRFQVQLVGSYDSLKSMLGDLERNNYPLRVIQLSFSTEESSGGLAEYALVLETYSLTSNQ